MNTGNANGKAAGKLAYDTTDEARDASVIDTKVSMLAHNAECVERDLHNLINRLRPVMQGSGPETEPTGTPRSVNESPLSGSLQDVIEKLGGISTRINSLHSYLDI